MRLILSSSMAAFITLSGCVTDETLSGFVEPGTVFELRTLDGDTFNARANITFPEPGQVAGQGPCNSFSARQSAPYPWFAIDAIAATRRACPELSQEAAFFDALGAMTLAEVSGRTLILPDSEGQEMVFEAP